jgi:hypothetical protein
MAKPKRKRFTVTLTVEHIREYECEDAMTAQMLAGAQFLAETRFAETVKLLKVEAMPWNKV